MNLKDALARVDDLLPALEKLLAPDAMLAFRTVYDAAQGSAVADVLRGVRQATAKALEAVGPVKALGPVVDYRGELVTPHLFLGGAGKTCAFCPHPRDHDIHPNRSAP